MYCPYKVPFEFTGNGKEFFRIWIVNLFLSVLTLGIYSAWAKVRTQRYFYSHTHLDGTCFEYTANPKQILLGRVIAVFVLAVTYLGQSFFPEFSYWILLPAVFILPWIILKSLQFRARNSVYRNIQFHFRGNYQEAVLTIVGYSLLSVLSLGLLSGFALKKYYEFVVTNSGYGDTHFLFETTTGEYYKFIVTLILLLIVLALTVSFGLGIIFFAISTLFETSQELAAQFITGGLLLVYVWQFAFIKARTVNLMYSGILVPEWYTFDTSITTWDVFKLYIINGILILLTLGLYIPFAKIKMAQYRVDHLQLRSTQSLDQFEFSQDPAVNAIGQEVGDIFDFGVSL